MADQAVVENLTRGRARAMQDRVESTKNTRAAKRHWRVPELAVGLVLMLGGALGALVLSRSGDSMVVVVGISHDLPRGTKIKTDDLIALETELSLSTSFIGQDQASSVIGQTLLIDVQASTPLTMSMLDVAEPLLATEALTSAEIAIGNFPADLAVGDFVRVITVPDLALSETSQPMLFDQIVTIWSLKKLEDSDHALITFRSSLDLSMAVASAGEVHLARVVQFASTDSSTTEGS